MGPFNSRHDFYSRTDYNAWRVREKQQWLKKISGRKY